MSLRRRVTISLVLMAQLAVCPAQERAVPKDASKPAASNEKKDPTAPPNGIYFQYALYFAPQPEGDALKRAREVFDRDFARQFTYRSAVSVFTRGNYVEFRQADPTDYAPPNERYLEHKGFDLTKTQRARLQKTATVVLLDFFIIEPRNFDYLRAANALAAAIAEATGGFIWDEETRELFSVAAWRLKRLSSDHPAFANTSMHGYQLKSQNYRSVTFGMRKLGLPDVVIAEFPKFFWEPCSELMQFLVTQTAVYGPLEPKTSWTKEEVQKLFRLDPKGDIPSLELVEAPRQEGDPHNDLRTISFLAYPGETYHERQAYALDRLLRHGLLDIWSHWEQIMVLSHEARARLKGKKALLERSLPQGEQFFVKAFVGEEYLWLRVLDWEDDQLNGVRVAGVTPERRPAESRGESILITSAQVFDYLHVKADGSQEGNETGKLIRRIQSQKTDSSKPGE